MGYRDSFYIRVDTIYYRFEVDSIFYRIFAKVDWNDLRRTFIIGPYKLSMHPVFFND